MQKRGKLVRLQGMQHAVRKRRPKRRPAVLETEIGTQIRRVVPSCDSCATVQRDSLVHTHTHDTLSTMKVSLLILTIVARTSLERAAHFQWEGTAVDLSSD